MASIKIEEKLGSDLVSVVVAATGLHTHTPEELSIVTESPIHIYDDRPQATSSRPASADRCYDDLV